MAYEYENRLKDYLIGHKNVNPKFDGFEILESLDELQEVYQKAKAFDEIRNVEDGYYEEHGEFISTEDFVYAVDTVLNNYKRSECSDDER